MENYSSFDSLEASDYDDDEESSILLRKTDSNQRLSGEKRRLLPGTRSGDVISPHRAVVTLAKCFFNAGCFSLPYAWMKGGLWVSFVGTVLIAAWNYYGARILVSSAQHLASVSKKPALDYGHFTKKVLDHSDVPLLKRHSKKLMYLVNVTIIFYQVGMCGVSLLFIATNMRKVVLDFTGTVLQLKIYITIALIPVMVTNLVAPFRYLSVFAVFSTFFFLSGTSILLYYCISVESLWGKLPASTDFTSTLMFFGITMYAFEGQTMILPIENKMEHPSEFLNNCGVLPTTYSLCGNLMIAIGFYGYTAFGEDTENPVTLNLPSGFIYTLASCMLMLQSTLGHCLALYAVLSMLWNGFQRKLGNQFPKTRDHEAWVNSAYRVFWVLVTYVLAMIVPSLDLLVPLVGVTSGTLCALVYPAFLEMVHFRRDWITDFPRWKYLSRMFLNSFIISFGLFAMVAGLYANIEYIIDYYSDSD